MALTVRVSAAARLVFFEGSGRLGFDEIAKVLAEMLEHPEFEPGLPQLCDLSAVTETDLTEDQLRDLARRGAGQRERLGSPPVAIVAPEAVVFGVMRMYEVLAEQIPIHIRVFREKHEALAWLEDAGKGEGS